MIKDYLNKEHEITWNLMLGELVKGTKGLFLVRELEDVYELKFSFALPKVAEVSQILEQILKFKGSDKKAREIK